jgi:hypothetical protein
MDDFVISNLHESRNEWCSRLVSIFTPLVIEGFRSIFNEAWKMCADTDEMNKYLMTFQNLLSRVPQWNSLIVEEERKRIVERSACNYLEDLITCVHIIQLKVLTCIRVGNKQKKIDISVPKLDNFVHKVYVHTARKIYMNIYLFEKNVTPLQQQKNLRELEVIVQECIMMTIRESIPTEAIIRAYMDESLEQEEEVFIEPVKGTVEADLSSAAAPSGGAAEEPTIKAVASDEVVEPTVPSVQDLDDKPTVTRLTFNDMDSVLTEGKSAPEEVLASKDPERLEQISAARAMERKLEEEQEEEGGDRIKIFHDAAPILDFTDLSSPTSSSALDLDLGIQEL